MVYSFFKWLLYLTVKGYFQSIHFKGEFNIPSTGPVIFVANHNSAFMDPIVLAVHMKRPIYFLARGESFKSKWASMFFSWIHMIPVYRPEMTPDEVYKNQEIFRKCFDHLSRGKAIMIFPEGFSKTAYKLRPLKTGTARIALGAEQQNDFNLGVKIVPIGINYSNPHYFQSDVFIHIGEPILLDKFQQSSTENLFNSAKELTNEIKGCLEKLLVTLEDESIGPLVEDIKRICRGTQDEEIREEHQVSQDFILSKQIVEAVTFSKRHRPELTFRFQRKIRQYFEILDRLNIRDAEFEGAIRNKGSWWMATYFIIGFPLFLYGYTVNILPYKAAELLSRKIIVRKDFIGSMKLVFGMFVFLLFYILQMSVVVSWTNWFWGIVFLLSLYPAGLFTLNYLNQWFRYQSFSTYIRLRRKGKGRIPHLRAIRNQLLEDLDNGREKYLKIHSE